MALQITMLEQEAAHFVAKQRLWLTADESRLVVEGDPEAAFLFAIPGHTISRADAERFGLLEEEAEAEAEAEATDEPPADELAPKGRSRR